jgi:hypothetical protein
MRSERLLLEEHRFKCAPVGVLDPATRPMVSALKDQIAAIDARLAHIAKALTDI